MNDEKELSPEKKFFDSLSEKDKRNYAALEALKIKLSRRVEVSTRLGINKHTIRQVIKDFNLIEKWKSTKIRKDGSGGKKN